MSTLSRFVQTLPSFLALEVLVFSMWSTMIITGTIFIGILFVFLSFKVYTSIKAESAEIGSIHMSFLLSLSGFRYVKNHVRHHLFETPLLPRRRYSSLSASWAHDIFKRMSFSSMATDIFAKDSTPVPLPLIIEKKRRSSTTSTTTDSYNTRRSSSSSKTKRLSVPAINVVQEISNISPILVAQSPQEKPVKLRRNTLPNIPSSEMNICESIPVNAFFTNSVPTHLKSNEDLEQEMFVPVPIEGELAYPLQKNSESASNLLSIFEEDEDFVEDSSESISEDSSVIITESEDEVILEIPSEPVPIKGVSASSIEQEAIGTSSPKSSYFRSSYLNYLPESIFGYSTGISKVIQAPSSSNLSAPPGFAKRAASHDYTHINTPINFLKTSPTDPFSNHQPLYARRRTETYKTLSHAAEPFISPELESKYPSSTQAEPVDMAPSRSNSSSPCLSDLQNTADLFAPINWNFNNNSNRNEEALRRSWDSLEDDQVEAVKKPKDKNSEVRRQSASAYSSIFERY